MEGCKFDEPKGKEEIEYINKEDKEFLNSIEIEERGVEPLIKLNDEVLEDIGEIIYELRTLKELKEKDELTDEMVYSRKEELIPKIIEWYSNSLHNGVPFPSEMLAGFAYQMFWSYMGTEEDFKNDYHGYLESIKKRKEYKKVAIEEFKNFINYNYKRDVKDKLNEKIKEKEQQRQKNEFI